MDSYGRSEAGLTWAIGVASGLDEGKRRAFQARDRRGHIGAATTGSQRTTAVTSGPASSQLAGHFGQTAQVAARAR